MISRKEWLLALVLVMVLGFFFESSAQPSTNDAKKVTVTLVRWPYT